MGREDEVRDLFDDHYDQVVRTAFLIVQDWGRAEEVAQDAFVQLLRYWPRVSRHEMPAAWVRRVALRLAVRWVRREQRLSFAMTQSAPPAVVADPAEAAVSADVLTALSKLPGREQLIAQIVGGISSPLTGFVTVLNNTVQGLVVALGQIAEQKQNTEQS